MQHKLFLSRSAVGMVIAMGLGVTACQKPADTANTTAATGSSTQTAPAGDLQKVRIATESSFVPFSYKDATGKMIGFEIDLANAMCQEAKLSCEIISQEWDGLIPGLQAQKYHAIMAGMSNTAERRKVVAFSEPYFQNDLVLLGKKGVDKGGDDLANKNVAVQTSTVAADYVAAHFPKAKVLAYKTQDEAYLDLESGRADVMLSDSAPALSWLKTPKGSGFEVKGAPINIDDKIAIAFRQNDPLVGQFNTALATLKSNGTYDKIYAKYFDSTQTTQAAASTVATTVAASSVTIVASTTTK